MFKQKPNKVTGLTDRKLKILLTYSRQGKKRSFKLLTSAIRKMAANNVSKVPDYLKEDAIDSITDSVKWSVFKFQKGNLTSFIEKSIFYATIGWCKKTI